MTLMELLGALGLTSLLTRTPSGIPLAVPAEFMVPSRRNVGPVIPYWVEEGVQGLARVIHYGGQPQARSKAGLIAKTATALHTSEFQDYSPLDYQNIVSPEGTPANDMGRWELARQTKRLKALLVNLRFAAVQMALSKGVVYFDKDGNLLPTSSTAVFTVDYAIPAGHKAQLNVFGAGNILDASWATATTNIPLHVKKILSASRKRSSMPVEMALYGDSTVGNMMSNTAIGKMLSSSANLSAAFQAQTIPDGFLGVKKWVPVGSAFYANAAGTLTNVFDDDAVVFCPMPSTSWYELVECSYIVPNQLGAIAVDAASAAAAISQVYGMFSYAKLKDEPVCIRQIVGDTFLPMITNNLAVFIADTEF